MARILMLLCGLGGLAPAAALAQVAPEPNMYFNPNTGQWMMAEPGVEPGYNPLTGQWEPGAPSLNYNPATGQWEPGEPGAAWFDPQTGRWQFQQ